MYRTLALSRKVIHGIRARLGHFANERTAWDRQYAEGGWDYMAGLDQSGRYGAIVSYVEQLKPRARILDAGCGTGILRQRLPEGSFAAYHGVDLSQVAIDTAERLSDRRTRFSVADLCDYDPAERYDVIVFNEVLYYLDEAPAVARRIVDAGLARDGVVIVSFNHVEHALFDWVALEGFLEPVHGVATESLVSGKRWICRVFRVR